MRADKRRAPADSAVVPMTGHSSCTPMHTVSVTADVGDQMGRVPLHYAALEGPVDQVRALLLEGADVATTDKQGFTALHFAC